jgi:hypothetical protein
VILPKHSGRVLDRTVAAPRPEILVTLATLWSAGYFLHAGGLAGLMTNFDNVLATAALTYGPVVWPRKVRGVPSVRRRKRATRQKDSQPGLRSEVTFVR